MQLYQHCGLEHSSMIVIPIRCARTRHNLYNWNAIIPRVVLVTLLHFWPRFNLVTDRKRVLTFRTISEAVLLLSLETAVAMTTCGRAVHWDRVWQYCGPAPTWYRQSTRVSVWDMSTAIALPGTLWSPLRVTCGPQITRLHVHYVTHIFDFVMSDLRFSRQWLWRMPSSGI
jgi:hypothetical protein